MVSNPNDIPQTPPPVRWWSRALRIFVAVVIIGAGVAAASFLINTAPKSKKRPPPKWVPLVQAEPLEPTRHRVAVTAMGTVVPARQVVLRARVSGQVIEVHPEFIEGGFIKAGDRLLQLDDEDYRLALAQKESDLVSSRYELQLEEGRQTVARREWEVLGRGRTDDETDTDLVLRKPHLDRATADVAAAEAAVEKARLDLARTTISAPFNAIVRSKSVDTGSQVSPQDPLAELVGTDTYWIQVSVPVDRLDWIRIPRRDGDDGSPARITYAGDQTIDGRVVRLLGDLTGDSRMARVVVAVEDPFRRREGNSGGIPLLIGDFVRVDIDGRVLDNVYVIPREALRDNQDVWIVDADGIMDIRQVTPVWRDAETVVIADGVAPGERLIVSDLPAPVTGMEVRVDHDRSPTAGPSAPEGS